MASVGEEALGTLLSPVLLELSTLGRPEVKSPAGLAPWGCLPACFLSGWIPRKGFCLVFPSGQSLGGAVSKPVRPAPSCAPRLWLLVLPSLRNEQDILIWPLWPKRLRSQCSAPRQAKDMDLLTCMSSWIQPCLIQPPLFAWDSLDLGFYISD